MADKQVVDSIRGLIAPWLEIDVMNFLDREPWGALNFADLTKTFDDKILPVFEHLNDLPIELLDAGVLGGFEKLISTLNGQLGVIDEFSVLEPDAPTIRAQVTADVQKSAINLYNHANSYLPYLIARTKPGSKAEKDLAKLDADFKASIKASKTLIGEVEALLSGVKAATAEQGVVGYTEFFAGEAANRNLASKWWLGFAIFFAIAAALMALGLLLGFFSPPQIDPNLPEGSRILVFVQAFAGRFVLLGIFVTAALWCGRQYNVQQNLRTINKHRSDTLHTFREFVEAAQTMEGRDQVLQEATKAIFRPLPTGHIAPTAQGAEGSTSVIEIVERTKKVVVPDAE